MKVRVKKEEMFRLVSSKTSKKAVVHSKFKNNDKNIMKGIWDEITHTFSGAGILASILIYAMGLTDGDLHTDNPLVLVIEDLSFGGGRVRLESKQFVYILHMKVDIEVSATFRKSP